MRSSLTRLACFVVGSAVLISAGCSGDSSGPEKSPESSRAEKSSELATAEKRLIGTWKAEEEGKKMVFEFKEDKTTTMTMDRMALSGTSSLVRAEGDKLTIKTALEMPSFKMKGDETTVEIETQEKEFTIEFETDDRMKMAPTDDPSDVLAFDRQK